MLRIWIVEPRLSGYESHLWTLRTIEPSSVLVFPPQILIVPTQSFLSALWKILPHSSGIYSSDKKSVEIPKIMYLFFYHGFQDCPFTLSVLKFHCNVTVSGIYFIFFCLVSDVHENTFLHFCKIICITFINVYSLSCPSLFYFGTPVIHFLESLNLILKSL